MGVQSRPRTVPRSVLLGAVLVPLFLTLAQPVGAFLVDFALALTASGSSFDFDVESDPQWVLDDGAGNVYRGVFDSARFKKSFGLVFKDRDGISMNGAPVEARIKGRIGAACEKAKIVLKDKTNRRTVKMAFPGADHSRGCASTPI